MTSKIGTIFRVLASSILEMDDTSVPYEQLEILNDFLPKHRFDLNGRDLDKLLGELKKKHLVDSITVVNEAGELVVSSEGNGKGEALSASTLLRYIDAELATPESVLIKGGNNWFMLFPFNTNTYVVRASSSLSNVEMRALAKEIEIFVEKCQKIREVN